MSCSNNILGGTGQANCAYVITTETDWMPVYGGITNYQDFGITEPKDWEFKITPTSIKFKKIEAN